MSHVENPFRPGTFTWLIGIEDTCVYPPDGGSPLDEHELTGHDRSWRSDLATVRDLGATAVRYGVSWPRVHIAPGRFHWGELDDVIAYIADELGLTMVADLVHYGTPRWLPRSFADSGYPAAVEEFAAAFGARYAGRVRHFTPLNEPVTTASFCGLRGVWPPRTIGWDGWTAVAVSIADGMARSTRALRAAVPGAVIMHVEAAVEVAADDPELDDHAVLLRNVGWLPTDLLLGRVGPGHHPMWAWLGNHGADPLTLERFESEPAPPDLIGVNYYPNLTPRRLTASDDRIVQIAHDRWTAGLVDAVRAFDQRYGLPIVITETSIEGDDELRTRWLTDSATTVSALAGECLDVRGYTWWPLLDFIDWSWAAGGADVEEFVTTLANPARSRGDPRSGKQEFLRRMGLVRLDEQPDGELARTITATAHRFAALADAGRPKGSS